LDSITKGPILVTGAAGRIGAVGRTVVELLRQRGLAVRALVHREDERADALRATGAEVVVADLTVPTDVARAMEGCRRIYFGMSVSASYLEATVIAAAVARERGDIEALVNISQMTVSQNEPDKYDGLSAAAAALARRAGVELVGTSRRARPPDGVPRKSSLHELGRSVDSKGRYDPAAIRHGPNVPGCG
jgi:uncharacterized protein YbjT (DUF2867 family)